MITRQDYMNKKATHREFYGQFVTPAIIDTVIDYIGKDKLVASTDKHFNDISLSQWDAMHQWLPAYYARAMKEAGSTIGVSLSNTVCVAKEAARQWLTREAA